MDTDKHNGLLTAHGRHQNIDGCIKPHQYRFESELSFHCRNQRKCT
jgi:hypothetical protein